MPCSRCFEDILVNGEHVCADLWEEEPNREDWD